MKNPQTQRDNILFTDSVVPYGNGIARFQNASIQQIEELIAQDFLKLDSKQSNSPTTQEFIKIAKDLIKKHPKLSKQIYFHGYVLDNTREEFKTTLEGMGIQRGAQEIKDELKIMLKNIFREADEFQCDNSEFFCWYD